MAHLPKPEWGMARIKRLSPGILGFKSDDTAYKKFFLLRKRYGSDFSFNFKNKMGMHPNYR